MALFDGLLGIDDDFPFRRREPRDRRGLPIRHRGKARDLTDRKQRIQQMLALSKVIRDELLVLQFSAPYDRYRVVMRLFDAVQQLVAIQPVYERRFPRGILTTADYNHLITVIEATLPYFSMRLRKRMAAQLQRILVTLSERLGVDEDDK